MLNDTFRTRVAEEIPRLRRYGLCLARDRDWANDLVQECLVRAIGNADKFRPGTNLRAWLMTILHNIYVNDVKRRRPSLTHDGSVDHSLPVAGNQEPRHQMRDVQRAFRRLSRPHRQIIRYICIEEMECREVGRQLGVSEGTVRSRLCRARDQLRRLIDARDPFTDQGAARNRPITAEASAARKGRRHEDQRLHEQGREDRVAGSVDPRSRASHARHRSGIPPGRRE